MKSTAGGGEVNEVKDDDGCNGKRHTITNNLDDDGNNHVDNIVDDDVDDDDDVKSDDDDNDQNCDDFNWSRGKRREARKRWG